MHRRRAAVWWNESHSTARWRKIKGDSSALSAGPVLAGSFCILVCVWYGVVLRLHLFVSLLAFSVAASRAMEQLPPPVCFDLSLGTILFASKRRVDFCALLFFISVYFIAYPDLLCFATHPRAHPSGTWSSATSLTRRSRGHAWLELWNNFCTELLKPLVLHMPL